MNAPKTQDTSNYEQQRAALLLDAAIKPVKRVRQYDGFINMHGDDAGNPDADGDSLWGPMDADELRLNDCVRVQIPKTMPAATAIRVLRKLLACVEAEAGVKPAAPATALDLATATLQAALAMSQEGGTF